ncbi:alanyl-tRNA editing protein [Fervidobacterium nodosum]|uniref:alanyl-tRNA editing protein n=1 Tax=Fervidobacterium nodosum TaxID=2424 RepID=UPI003B75B7EA
MIDLKILGKYLGNVVNIEKFENKDGKYYAYAKISPFYPDWKGGQLGDRGFINGAKVLSVKETEEWIIHELDKPIELGIYEVQIDENRRKDIAQQHTGQHILSAAFIHVAEIETVGFHMGEEYSTIDLDIPYIEPDVLNEVEELSNQIIQSNIQIEEIITDVNGANTYPLRKKLSDKIKEEVRLIKIGDFDISACGGFHTDYTGEVGLIKIIDTEKVKGNLTRVYAVSGMRALKYFQKYNSVLKDLSKLLTSSIDELNLRTQKLLNQVREQALTLSKLSEEYAKLLATNLQKEGLIYLEGYYEVGNFLWKILDLSNAIFVYFDGEKYIIASKKHNVKDVIKALVENYGGKGGGKEDFGNYMNNKKLSVDDFEKILED